MHFLLDVHLPISLSKFLNSQKDSKATHINQILQRWNTTDKICRYADEHGLIVITKDQDFKNAHFINRTPKKVIRIILGNIANKDLVTLFEKHLPSIIEISQKETFYLEMDFGQIIES